MSARPAWQPTLSKESAFDPNHPAWKLWHALLSSPAPTGSEEAAELLSNYQRWYAHELAEKQRAFIDTALKMSPWAIGPDGRPLRIDALIDLIDPTAAPEG